MSTTMRILKKAEMNTTQKNTSKTTITPDNKIIFFIFNIFLFFFSINFRSWNIHTRFAASQNFSRETLGVCKIYLSKKTDINKVSSQNEPAMKTVRYNRDKAKDSSSPSAVELLGFPHIDRDVNLSKKWKQ